MMAWGFVLWSSLTAQSLSPSVPQFEGTLEEMLAYAKKTNQYVYLDFYTDWCRPCKMMDYSTFLDTSLIRFFKNRVLLKKINSEKDTLTPKVYQAFSYPDCILLNPNGEKVWKFPGYMDAEFLLYHFKKVMRYSPEKETYLQNPQSASAFISYLKSIEPYQDSVLKEIDIHFNRISPEKRILPAYHSLYFQYLKNIQNPHVVYLMKHLHMQPYLSPELTSYVLSLLQLEKKEALRTLDKTQWNTYLEWYVLTMPSLAPEPLPYPIEYYKTQENWDFYYKKRDKIALKAEIEPFLEKYHAKDAKMYALNAIRLMESFSEPEMLKIAERLIDKAFTIDAQNEWTLYAKAYFAYRNQAYSQAENWLLKTQTLTLSPECKSKTTELIQKIEKKRKE